MILFMWNKIFSPSTAHIYDVLKDIEKKLPKKNNETADDIFQKYWVCLKETINEEFKERNKGDVNCPIYKVKNDYLKHCITSICNNFNNAPLPVKYGFLWWFYKSVMNSSIKEIEEEISNVPEEIKEIISLMENYKEEKEKK